ncbi:transcriptional regulator [Niallia circulans]|uniref:MurR/RpiR family transcriptional regulator n=1 Tax=Niallia circulans TaxID=1397 RepID=UPI0009ECFD30|nr:MurR/RpiR family transcriptional regulator [Niallia circulans]SPT85018.1 transcriptional regulator [Niallia circulans]
MKLKDIIFRLLDFINNNKTKDTNYYIALTLLKDVRHIANMNITVLAEACYTSPAAITRFCKKIGYASFQEFKDIAQMDKLENPVEEYIESGLQENEVGEQLQRVLYQKMAGWLHTMEARINVGDVRNILEIIYEAKKVSFFGTQLSQAMAQDFQYRLVKSGKFVHAFSDIQEQMKDIAELDEQSVAIITSPSGRFIEGNTELIQLIRKSNAKIIVITHNESLPIVNKANLFYRLHGQTYDRTGFSSERFGLMYFFDFAIAFYQKLYPAEKNHRE